MTQAYNFNALGEALISGEHVGTGPREALLRRYRREVAALLIGLRAHSVIGQNTLHPDPPEACDTCATNLEEAGVFIDGATGDTPFPSWSNMCMPCYLATGAGIGWGIGQLYDLNDTGWQMIGGGDPQPSGEDE